MRKLLSLVLILLVLGLFSSAQAQTELKHTVKPSGQGGDFTALAAAINHLAASHSDLVSANVYATIEIDGTWSTPDTAQVTIQNITTDATHYIYIYTTAAARHPGYPDATKYRLVLAGAGAGCVTVSCQYTRVEGLQLQNTETWGDSVGLRVMVSNVRIYKCLATSAATNGFQDDDLGKAIFYNCLGYNSHFAGFGLHGTCYNCTAVHNEAGFRALAQPSVATNCLAHGNTTDFARFGSDPFYLNYCASSDGTADDFIGTGNRVNQTFTFVNHDGNDFHLASGDTGAKGYGVTDPGSGLFSDDVDGQTRVAPWDIGFDEYVSAGAGYYVFDGHDFDGNGRSDISVWRPSNGIWFIKDIAYSQWGTTGDIPVNGDYDGNLITDVAVWRPSNGVWFVKNQSTFQWGTNGDIPVPGKYDSVNKTEMAVWRPSDGCWYMKYSGGGVSVVQWGTSGDIPVPRDYDGDGITDIAVWRPSSGLWFIKYSGGGVGVVQWGTSGDIPVPGKYDSDSKTDIAVWRPSNGHWFVQKSAGGVDVTQWGTSGDLPVPGDYDGNGRTDIAVFRPSNGLWFVKDQMIVQWGTSGDVPLVR